MIELRDYQIDAIERTRDLIRQRYRRILINAPTGAGKTVISSAIIRGAVLKESPSLFLAHRRELINQCCEKLEQAGVLAYGTIMSGDKRFNAEALVNVASVQTLTRRKLPPARLVVIDEAHRAASKSYVNLIANYPKAVILGLTATPERMDGKGLDTLFDEMVVVDTVPGLIERGFLVKPSCYAARPGSLALKGVRTKGGDYDEGQLQQAMDKPKLIGDLVDNWQRLADGLLTVVFATGVDHAIHVAEQFQSRGIAAAYVTGDMAVTEREAVIDLWRKGSIRVMVNCMILVEGFDFPELECCVLARPTKSVSLFLQMVGRVMRTAGGKQQALVLDHAGCLDEHGLPNIERVWTLQGMVKASREQSKNLTQCRCGFLYFPEPKFWIDPVQPKLSEGFLKNNQSLFHQDKKARSLALCPSCQQTKCKLCNEIFVAKPINHDSEDLDEQKELIRHVSCPACQASYHDEPETISEASGAIVLPGTMEADLVQASEAVPIKVTVLNRFRQRLNEASRLGFKRGWAFHQIEKEFGEDAINYLPRHRGDWWRKKA